VHGAFKNASFKIDDRMPLPNGGGILSPSKILTLFRLLLKESRAKSSCAQVLAQARTATSQ
jgi:hypothetical protein